MLRVEDISTAASGSVGGANAANGANVTAGSTPSTVALTQSKSHQRAGGGDPMARATAKSVPQPQPQRTPVRSGGPRGATTILTDASVTMVGGGPSSSDDVMTPERFQAQIRSTLGTSLTHMSREEQAEDTDDAGEEVGGGAISRSQNVHSGNNSRRPLQPVDSSTTLTNRSSGPSTSEDAGRGPGQGGAANPSQFVAFQSFSGPSKRAAAAANGKAAPPTTSAAVAASAEGPPVAATSTVSSNGGGGSGGGMTNAVSLFAPNVRFVSIAGIGDISAACFSNVTMQLAVFGSGIALNFTSFNPFLCIPIPAHPTRRGMSPKGGGTANFVGLLLLAGKSPPARDFTPEDEALADCYTAVFSNLLGRYAASRSIMQP